MTKLTIWDPAIGERPASLALANNFTATVDPTASNDKSQGYEPGSTWINASAKRLWQCFSNATGAAVWLETQSAGGEIVDVSAAYNVASNAVSFTASAAQLVGGSANVVLDLTGNPAGAANVTLPTVSALVAALVNAQAGDSYMLRIKNSANSNTWTVLTAAGWTLSGTMTIATGTYRDFVVTLTTLSAATLQNAGGGATL